MHDLEIVMQNRPGELALMGETLGRAGISIEGGGMFLVGDQGVAHFLFGDGPAAREALRTVGMAVNACREVLVQRLSQDEPGQLGKICRRMADAGVNIEVLYSDHEHRLILVVDDSAKGKEVSDEWTRHRRSTLRDGERVASLRKRFSELHAAGTFVIPNAWDIGSARILESLGFPAIATTSSGHAASLGRMDQHVALDELLDHVEALVRAVNVPVSVDSERCFADDPEGVAATVEKLAQRGAAGVSIEDYDPDSGIDPIPVASERVTAAARAARAYDLVLTARAENHLYGIDDLDDTIARLRAYRDAGADLVYAPGLVDIDAIDRVVADVGIPVNVLARPNGPSVPQLAAAGVRRVSTGGSLAFAAYGALAAAGRELLSSGTSTYASAALSADDRRAAFRA
jgi:2-methylisocitrate lyase-like PEP mutase family enzyme